jgi:Fe-S cluster assembly protein SufD
MNFLEAVEAQFSETIGRAAAPERAARERAWTEFHRLGLPTRKTETWKYSSVAGLTKTAWREAAADAKTPQVATELVEKWRDRFDVLIVVNGEPRLDESAISSEMKEMLGAAPIPAENLAFEDGFQSLSLALSRGGIRLRVPRGMSVPRPILLVRAQVGESGWSSVYNEIEVGDGGRLQLAEIFVGEAGDSYMRSEVTRIHLAAAAQIEFLRVQSEGSTASHFSDLELRLGESAQAEVYQLNGGAAWSRTSMRAEILHELASAQMSGLSFGRDRRHLDQRVVMNHRAGNTQSAQLFKSVLKDQSRGILNGKIFIAKDAQKVASLQMNHNLLLSPTAEADTKPELEIYADDVKANHGATVGRLDEEKLFYLVSRGIRPAEAQQMLAHAFIGDVLMKIRQPDLRALADDRVGAWLPEFATEMSL